jgi:uncharacterized protein YukE
MTNGPSFFQNENALLRQAVNGFSRTLEMMLDEIKSEKTSEKNPEKTITHGV